VAKKPVFSLRKPPEPAVEAFVAGERSGSQTSKRSNGKTAKGSSVRSSVLQRKDGRSLRRMTVYLPTDLAKRLAVRCAEEDRDISDLISQAVELTLRAS
jgi:hypothetical protein